MPSVVKVSHFFVQLKPIDFMAVKCGADSAHLGESEDSSHNGGGVFIQKMLILRLGNPSSVKLLWK